MNKLLVTVLIVILGTLITSQVKSQGHVVFPDLRDTAQFTIEYVVFAEGKLGDLRDDLQGVKFESNALNNFFNFNNRKMINVILLRALKNKNTEIFDQLYFYSVREKDFKLIEEVGLKRPNNVKDIDLFVLKVKF